MCDKCCHRHSGKALIVGYGIKFHGHLVFHCCSFCSFTDFLLLDLNHAYIIAAWNQWGPDNIILEAFVVVILAIIMSFLCYHAGKWIRKGIEYAVKEAVPSQS